MGEIIGGTCSESGVENGEEDVKEKYKSKKDETLELLFKSSHINTTLIWFATTMATIAAINTLVGSFMYKALVFLAISLVSIAIYYKRMK